MRAYADNDYPADHKPDWKVIARASPEARTTCWLALALNTPASPVIRLNQFRARVMPV